jgi:hypothetical protein
MGDWHDFLLALAGAAGVLTGLVFVGVSINLEKIMSQPGFGLPGNLRTTTLRAYDREETIRIIRRLG